MKSFFLYSFVIFAFISDHNSTLVCPPPQNLCKCMGGIWPSSACKTNSKIANH